MRKKYYFCTPQFPKAQVAELVDAHVSGACAARRAGSIPVLGTKNPVRGNSEGIFLFPCPHRVRNFMEKGSDFSLPERQNQIIFTRWRN